MSNILNIPIKSIENAKAYFFAMGCSHFHMSRESFDRYAEYKSLNISEETEAAWRKEKTEAMFSAFPYDDEKSFLLYFSSLRDQIEGTSEEIECLANIADTIKDRIPLNEVDLRSFVSTITGSNGQATHGGLIELAYRKGCYSAVNRFVDICKTLLLRAMEHDIELDFVFGYFVDVIGYYKLNVDSNLLTKFRQQNETNTFRYYYRGAQRGNVFSMRMLAKCYIESIGCEKSIQEAKHWLQEAVDNGNELAKVELKALEVEH